MEEDPACWSVVEALAWIKWQSLEAVELFGDAEGPANWNASLVYPDGHIRPGGRAAKDFMIKNARPERALLGALRRGRIIGFRLIGGELEPFDPAFWIKGQLGPKGAFNLSSGLPLTPVFFRRAEVRERWDELSEFQAHNINLEEELRLFLKNTMSSRRKGPGDSREKLRSEFKWAVGERPFRRIYREVAREIGNGWNKSGPGKKPG
jgi:hypothetical protein